MKPKSWFKLEIVSLLSYYGILAYQIIEYGQVTHGFLLFSAVTLIVAIFLGPVFLLFPSLSDWLVSYTEEIDEDQLNGSTE